MIYFHIGRTHSLLRKFWRDIWDFKALEHRVLVFDKTGCQEESNWALFNVDCLIIDIELKFPSRNNFLKLRKVYNYCFIFEVIIWIDDESYRYRICIRYLVSGYFEQEFN